MNRDKQIEKVRDGVRGVVPAEPPKPPPSGNIARAIKDGCVPQESPKPPPSNEGKGK
jgi:hypothetical protein